MSGSVMLWPCCSYIPCSFLGPVCDLGHSARAHETLGPLAPREGGTEELVSIVKILLAAAVIAATAGSVAAYSYAYHSLSVGLIAVSEEDTAIPPQPERPRLVPAR